MHKIVFECPVLRQVHPAVVFLFPAVVTQAADLGSGKHAGLQRGSPHPFLFGGMGRQFSLTITVARELLFGAHDPNRAGMIDEERESLGIPELDLVSLAFLLLREMGVGRAGGEQADRGLVQIGAVLFQTDD